MQDWYASVVGAEHLENFPDRAAAVDRHDAASGALGRFQDVSKHLSLKRSVLLKILRAIEPNLPDVRCFVDQRVE
jgi:hypothetical protein